MKNSHIQIIDKIIHQIFSYSKMSKDSWKNMYFFYTRYIFLSPFQHIKNKSMIQTINIYFIIWLRRAVNNDVCINYQAN